MPKNQPPQSADVNVNGGQAAGIQLPPALENLISTLRDDRKALLKDKPIADAATTTFLAHFLYPRIIECVEALGVGLTETYMVASQSLTEVSRMREYVDKKVAQIDLGADEEGATRVDNEDLEALREALAALGLMLQRKVPDDVELQVAFNLVTDSFVDIAGDGALEIEEDDEDEDEDEDEDDDDEEDDEDDEDEASDLDDEPGDAEPDGTTSPGGDA